MVEVSVVIPTYNEEKYLPRLLNCLKKQTYEDFEIIVSDADSKDRTREIAKENKCKIVKGGAVSVGRNRGTKIAKGKYLMFFDSDVIFGNKFIEENLTFFKRKNLVSSTCWSIFYDKKHKVKSIIPYTLHQVGNISKFLTQKIRPLTDGHFVMTRKDIFDRLKGFDERMDFGEDSDYVLRSIKYGRFSINTRTNIYPSLRRFFKNGVWYMTWKYIALNFRRLVLGSKKYTGYFEGSAR